MVMIGYYLFVVFVESKDFGWEYVIKDCGLSVWVVLKLIKVKGDYEV